MKCQNCGNQVLDSANFCEFCGSKVIQPDENSQIPDNIKELISKSQNSSDWKIEERLGKEFYNKVDKISQNEKLPQDNGFEDEMTVTLESEDSTIVESDDNTVPIVSDQNDLTPINDIATAKNNTPLILAIIAAALVTTALLVFVVYYAFAPKDLNAGDIGEYISETEIDDGLESKVDSDDFYESQVTSSEVFSQTEDYTPYVQNHNIMDVWSSSYLDESKNVGIRHTADRVVDGKMDTAWTEGVNGYGIGEYITIQLDAECYVSGIDIWAGYHKTTKLYNNNARPHMVEISSSDGVICKGNLNDVMQKQTISFGSEVKTDTITIKILSVYPGKVYQDTVITEIELY